MHNHSAIVTGGAQGIGKAISAALIESGLHVLMLDRDNEAGRESAEELSRDGRAVFMLGDAGSEKDVKRAVSAANKLGEGLYAAVANAGIMDMKPLAELSLRDWNLILGTNLTSGFLLARHAAPLLAQTQGAMVLIASTRAQMSEADDIAYAASKGGIVGMTQALAMSLGPEVRVNCISPGWILTDAWHKRSQRHTPRVSKRAHQQHPVGRVGKPEDIGALARFLLSPEAGFITGANYVADGGMTRKMIYV